MISEETSQGSIVILLVVNGEDVEIQADLDARLGEVCGLALAKSRNTGRPIVDWEIRREDGSLVAPRARVWTLRLAPRSLLFLSLRVGAGGGRLRPWLPPPPPPEAHP